jgi:hypothetical protein
MGPQTWERMAEKDEGRVQVKEVESKGSGWKEEVVKG